MSCLKRKDSFFGLHFDFHASPQKCAGIKQGEELTEENIRKICRTIKPDFIQIDCKGHPGWTSYPSKLGNAVPDFAKDTLALWRKVTAEENVALYMHYSGIYDHKYAMEHPEECAMRSDGTYNESMTSNFGNYVDDLMIPQLLELASYGVDGVWVDGEAWAVQHDFSPRAVASFKEKYGVDLTDDLPTKREHPYYYQYKEHLREQFRKYLTHYCDAIHKEYPDFQIASNWAYSEQMPEKITTPVDFLSGDYAPFDSVRGASFSGRILAAQGLHWDLMSWGFRNIYAGPMSDSTKHPIQLMQEASAIMMLGGSYQNYTFQNLDGSPQLEEVLRLKPLAEYCRERQPYCQGVKNIPQTVIFNSTVDHYRGIPTVLGNAGCYNSVDGWTDLLQSAGHSFEIREEHNLFDRIDDYKLVVVPEPNIEYEEDAVNTLINYAENGGCLVVAGAKAVKQFAKFLDAEICDREVETPYISTDGDFWAITTHDICSIKGGEVYGYAKGQFKGLKNIFPFAAKFEYGKGKIILIGTDIGADNPIKGRRVGTIVNRMFAEKLLDEYEPIARVNGSHYRAVNLTEKGGKTLLHILNIAGDHSNTAISTYDEIPVLHNLTVTVNGNYKNAVLQPEGIELPISYNNGVGEIKLPPLEIHSILELA